MSPFTGPITLNVGGTKFITAASTLTSNSEYFASLLSDDWNQDRVEWSASSEIFIDQDPVPFGILLAYMRRGMIKVDDIDTDVLILAEFLGLEKLLLGVKVRWYCNIGRGPVLSTEGEMASAFDQEHGGIQKAISTGLFPLFLKQDDVNAEKEFATVSVAHELEDTDNVYIGVHECNIDENEARRCDSLVGALNGIFAKGYNRHEGQMDRHDGICEDCVTFSRRKHSNLLLHHSTEIFIPSDKEVKEQREVNCRKQFAMLLIPKIEDSTYGGESDKLIIPAESDLVSPYVTTQLEWPENNGVWLQKQNFVTIEDGLAKLFESHFAILKGKYYDCRVYSRMTPIAMQQQNDNDMGVE